MNSANDNWRIFVVDDDIGVLRTVGRILDSEGYQVSMFDCSDESIERARVVGPDLAIVDIRMPNRDGFSLMAELKKVSPGTEVILMTGSVHETDQSLIKAIRNNAFYFVTKPFDRDVLLALVERCLELKRLEAANTEYVDRMRRQLLSALALQKTMLPASEFRFAGYRLSAKYLPCDELAGDYFDYAVCAGDAISVLIADVVGHGASAAMLTSVVKSAFHKSRVENYEPTAVVKHLSQDLAAFASDQYVTVICAKVFPNQGELRYVNAGHSGGLIVSTGGTVQPLDANCSLVGSAFPNQPFDSTLLPWTRHDALLLYTDGVTEAWGEGDMFGEPRLREVVERAAADNQLLSAAVADAVARHIGTSIQMDDVTVLSLQRDSD